MKNNRDAIKILGFISLWLIVFLVNFEINGLLNSFFEAVLINLITGCVVSIVVSYIDYKNIIDEELEYFCNQMQIYYQYLLSIEKCTIEYKDPKKCIQFITSYLKDITDNAIKKKKELNLYWIFTTSNKIELQKSINELYELTFGIDLSFKVLKLKIDKTINNKLLKSVIGKVKEEIYIEKSIIDDEMKKIKNNKIINYWNYYIDKYSKINN